MEDGWRTLATDLRWLEPRGGLVVFDVLVGKGRNAHENGKAGFQQR